MWWIMLHRLPAGAGAGGLLHHSARAWTPRRRLERMRAWPGHGHLCAILYLYLIILIFITLEISLKEAAVMKSLVLAAALTATLSAPASAAIYITTADVVSNVAFSF
jgi:hypothetical protein